MRALRYCGLLVGALGFAHATTLQQLSLNDMSLKSTAIVRGVVQMTGGAVHSGYIYTHYTIQVVEMWKGAPAAQIDFVLPGGSANGMRQSIAGSPNLVNGQEYVLFLWTSRTGLTHVIGMSQGVFVSANGMVMRSAATEPMVSSTGASVSDSAMQMTLGALRAQVAKTLGGH